MALPKLALSCFPSAKWMMEVLVCFATLPSEKQESGFSQVHLRSWGQEGTQIIAEARESWGVAATGDLPLEKWGEGHKGHQVQRQGELTSVGEVLEMWHGWGTQRQEGLGLNHHSEPVPSAGILAWGPRTHSDLPHPPSSPWTALTPFFFYQKYQK